MYVKPGITKAAFTAAMREKAYAEKRTKAEKICAERKNRRDQVSPSALRAQRAAAATFFKKSTPQSKDAVYNVPTDR
mgnify:CR=1 FL=1